MENAQSRVPKRCMPGATACLNAVLLSQGPGSGSGIGLTSLFRTPGAAFAAHRRTLALLPTVGGSQPPPPAVAQLLGRRKEHYSARVTARKALKAGRASATFCVEHIAITGGPDASRYDAEFLYIIDGRTTMSVIVAPRSLSPEPQQLLERIAARIQASTRT